MPRSPALSSRFPGAKGSSPTRAGFEIDLFADIGIVTDALHLSGAARWRGRTSSPKLTFRGLWYGSGGSGRATGSHDPSKRPTGSRMSFRKPDVTGQDRKRFPNGSSGKDDVESRGIDDCGAAVVLPSVRATCFRTPMPSCPAPQCRKATAQRRTCGNGRSGSRTTSRTLLR